IWCHSWRPRGLVAGLVLGAATIVASIAPLLLIDPADPPGLAAPGLWLLVPALACLAWRAMAELASLPRSGPLVPALFGLCLLYVWAVAVRGFGVPRVLLPPPSAIGMTLASSVPTLAADFRQTFIRAVIPGWLMGCGAGFVTALLVDCVPFLQ